MSKNDKVTIDRLMGLKRGSDGSGRRIAAVTVYDYPFARLADRAGMDLLLVGDSGGMVTLGYDSTIPVSMNEMLTMSKAVSRGAHRPLLIGDMPFMSFASKQDALTNGGLFLKEGGMDAVKLEGGSEYADIVRALTRAGIPVMGHVGLKPQRAKFWHGYRIEGKDCRSARVVIEDALELESSGVFALVLEMVASEVAKVVTEKVSIPTVGIGSGPFCDGQILVLHDVLGLYDNLTPRFAKKYVDLSPVIISALSKFKDEVIVGKYPERRHSAGMESSELGKLQRLYKAEKDRSVVSEA